MKILVIGGEDDLLECRQKFGENHSYARLPHADAFSEADQPEVIFDFNPEQNFKSLVEEIHFPAAVFANSCKTSLAALGKSVNHQPGFLLFGFCGLPTFLNRPLLEVSLYRPDSSDELKKSCEGLGTAYAIVDDRVGLVTPRIIGMIINEAYYTVQEGTASREDIDLAMKLGTNYPFGPFEWAKKIGIQNIYELLAALYDDTKDERYKICPLIKKEYLTLR